MNLFYSPSLRQFVKSLTDLRPAGMLVFSGPTESLTIAFVAPSGGALALLGSSGIFAIAKRSDVRSTLALSTVWTLAEDGKSAVVALEVDTIEARVALESGPITSFTECLAQLSLTVSGQSAVNSNFLYSRILNTVIRPDGEPPSVSSEVLWSWVTAAVNVGAGLTKAANNTTHVLTLALDSTVVLQASQLDTDSTFAANSDTRVPSQKAVKTALSAEVAARIAADALKADLVGGVIPTAQLPALAVIEFLGTVDSQAAMLALSGQKGDWCNRSDVLKTYQIVGTDPTNLASWQGYDYPLSPVMSVNGQVGTVVLGKEDVGLSNVDNTSDANKPVSAAQQVALDGKAAATHASRHKSGGADPIKLDELAAPTDITTLNATTSVHGLMSKTDKSKLDGIASNANNYVLPAPGVSTLGGVMRNAGISGQYVKGIDGTGALVFDTPAGGGGSGANGMAGFAFIDTVTGSDSTAVLGDPSKPYLTAAAGAVASQAFLGGYNAQLYFKTACSEYLTFYQPYTVWIYGDTAQVCNLVGLYFTGVSSGTARVIGNGRTRVSISNIVLNGVQGFAGTDGFTDGENGGAGSDGQVAATLDIRDVTIWNVQSSGGVGGNGGAGAYNASGYGGTGGNGGTGGAGGEIIIADCALNTGAIQSTGGNGGNGGTAGGGDFGSGSEGSAGGAGSGGVVSIFSSRPVQNGVTAPTVSSIAGTPGFGSGGSGMAGSNGAIKLSWSETGSYTAATGEVFVSRVSNTFVDYFSF